MTKDYTEYSNNRLSLVLPVATVAMLLIMTATSYYMASNWHKQIIESKTADINNNFIDTVRNHCYSAVNTSLIIAQMTKVLLIKNDIEIPETINEITPNPKRIFWIAMISDDEPAFPLEIYRNDNHTELPDKEYLKQIQFNLTEYLEEKDQIIIRPLKLEHHPDFNYISFIRYIHTDMRRGWIVILYDYQDIFPFQSNKIHPKNISINKIQLTNGTEAQKADFSEGIGFENFIEIDNNIISIETSVNRNQFPEGNNFKYFTLFGGLFVTFSLIGYLTISRRILDRSLRSMIEKNKTIDEINKQIESDMQKRISIQALLIEKNEKLKQANEELENAKAQLIQSEKLASIGQLAAGVAHEINNPIGFVNSNINTIDKYTSRLSEFIKKISELSTEHISIESSTIREIIKECKVENSISNLIDIASESREGLSRVTKIVRDLKTFSRQNDESWEYSNIIDGIESTLNIVNNEIKYKAEIIREYDDIPLVYCVPSQINQVIMNLVVNSCHAIESSGSIYIRVKNIVDKEQIQIQVEDTGSGIPPDIMKKIFDPFFTTKEVGKGTGLGLSLSYGIIQSHNGSIHVDSVPGKGTCFTITIPVNQSESLEDRKNAANQ